MGGWQLLRDRVGLGRESFTKDGRRRERFVDHFENPTITEPRISVDGNCGIRGKSDRKGELMDYSGILVKGNPTIGGVGNPRIAARGDSDPLEASNPRLYTRFSSIGQ